MELPITHTIDDIYALPDGERAELIDGRIYYMVPPSRKHQDIIGELFGTIDGADMNEYSFTDNIPVGIYPNFSINLSKLNI